MTKSQQIYPTDLNDTQWLKIRPYLPTEALTGRPREHGWRRILKGIFYILRSGCSWRMLPRDLPPWKTVYHYFRLWRTRLTWEKWSGWWANTISKGSMATFTPWMEKHYEACARRMKLGWNIC